MTIGFVLVNVFVCVKSDPIGIIHAIASVTLLCRVDDQQQIGAGRRTTSKSTRNVWKKLRVSFVH